jgi:peptidoglycan/xylan/chitin deacetylase (PgdA/CDA1 family)
MTIDVDPSLRSIPNFITEDGLDAILSLLDRYAVKATFFIPSLVAGKFPVITREIVKQGHEVACHGLKHDPWETTLNANKQVQMIKTATETIQSIIGLRPVGFRAPLFRGNKNCWIALQKNGYVYDSSVVCSPFYNNHRIFFPTKPFHLPVSKTNKNNGLLEIPVSVNPLLPFPLGGAPMRILGLRWCKIGAKINFTQRLPVVFYIHPKDVIPRTYGRNWISYRNTLGCIKMVEEIIKYAKQSASKFLTAFELARLFETKSL